MDEPKKKKLKLPLTPEQIKELPYRELVALNSLEKHWNRILISWEGVWLECDQVSITVPKAVGYAVAKGEMKCPVCKGLNNNRVKTREYGQVTGLQRTFLVDCECRKWAFLNKLLDKELPVRYRNVDLDTLVPQSPPSTLSEEVQAREIEHFREEPVKSYFFSGPAGSSKTTFITALYRRALEENADFLRDPFKENVKFIWRVDAQNLLKQFHRQSMDIVNAPEPDVTKDKLNAVCKKYGVRPIVILEEIDKLKATKGRLDSIFDVIDGVYENEGILILSTNLTPGEFDAAFGAAVARRVIETCDTRNYWTPEEEEQKLAELKRTQKLKEASDSLKLSLLDSQ